MKKFFSSKKLEKIIVIPEERERDEALKKLVDERKKVKEDIARRVKEEKQKEDEKRCL